MKQTHAYVLIAGASIIWGTMGILGKLAFEYGIHPATLIAFRLLVSSVTILAPITIFKRGSVKIQRNHFIRFLLLGIFATAFQRIAYFYAIDLTTATIAAILFHTYPIFVAIYSSAFLKEKITFLTVFSIILAFAGVTLVVRAYDTSQLNLNFIGIVLGLLSSLLFLLYFFITKKLRKYYSPWSLILYGDGIGALALFPLIVGSSSAILNYPLQFWLLILAIAWGPSLLAYFMYSYALKNVEPAKGSTLGVLEPLFAAVFSAMILGEIFELLQIVGITLTLVGVALLFYKRR